MLIVTSDKVPPDSVPTLHLVRSQNLKSWLFMPLIMRQHLVYNLQFTLAKFLCLLCSVGVRKLVPVA